MILPPRSRTEAARTEPRIPDPPLCPPLMRKEGGPPLIPGTSRTPGSARTAGGGVSCRPSPSPRRAVPTPVRLPPFGPLG